MVIMYNFDISGTIQKPTPECVGGWVRSVIRWFYLRVFNNLIYLGMCYYDPLRPTNEREGTRRISNTIISERYTFIQEGNHGRFNLLIFKP